jgi:integrase/recombinase XerD
MKNNNFQSLLQCFFLERLMKQKNASPCTVSSYRDTFRIFLKYMKEKKQCDPSQITIAMVNAENIIDFLNYIETVRNNSIKTRNNRLAAIHSFMEYVSFQAPEYLAIVQRVMSVPFKKAETRNVDYLIKEEVDSILEGCDLSCWLGRRDRIMISLLYNTGVRVSELVSIKKKDVILNRNGTGLIHVIGKGRKERTIPIWKTTQNYLTEFFKEISGNDEDYLFTSERGEQLTRSGVTYRLDCLVKTASLRSPSILKKRVTPHVFRHTTAMHLLESGVDISTIAIWLGHESIETTHKYMVADIRLKETALAKTTEPNASEFRYKPSTDVLSFLDTL